MKKNDKIEFNYRFQIPISKFNYKVSSSLIPQKAIRIRVLKGAEFAMLTAVSELKLLKEEFTISQNSDRMGFRLRGEPLYLLDKLELISSAVNFGTIQLLPDGQMIVLMADHQTSGGYPRIANVISADLPRLAQFGANDNVNFQLITQSEAEDIFLRNEIELNYLKFAVQGK